MKRLVLVHGINQQGKSADTLRREWLGHLNRALVNPDAFRDVDVVAPFYGDELERLAGGGDVVAVSQGPDGTPNSDEAAFLAGALLETAMAAGIGPSEIAAEQRLLAQQAGNLPQEQNIVMNRRLNAIVRVLEKLSPLHGAIVMRVLKQAYSYLKRPSTTAGVDAIVRPTLEQMPSVIVSHSLGTIVTFKLLRRMALEGKLLAVPLYVTVGSPLPLLAVQAALGPVFGRPPGVQRWLNALDPDDFITLGKPLDDSTFAGGIDNIVDVENDPENGHAISGYLGDVRVASAIARACGV
jgi:hypothetical protein